MIQKVLVTPIIGLPQINGWAQVTQSSDGTFISVFSIKGSQAGNVGRDLVDVIKDNAPQSPTAVYALMKKIVRFVMEKDCSIEIAASYFNQDSMIFTAYDASLLLKRNSKVGVLLAADTDIKIIEGQRIPEDIFVLLTNSALEFKGEIVQKLSQGIDADTTVASIVPGVQNLEDSSLVGMAFLSDLPQEYLEKSQSDEYLQELENETPIIEFTDDQSEMNTESDSPTSDEKQPIVEAVSGKKRVSFDKAQLQAVLQKSIVQLKKVGVSLWVLLLTLYRRLRQRVTKDVYIDEKAKNTKKRLRIIVISVILILLLVIPIVFFRVRANAQVTAATQEISPLISSFSEAQNNVEADPIQTREQIAGIIAELEAKQKAFSDRKAGQAYITDQLDSIKSYYESISGKEVFNELEVFYDFQLVESDFIASKVSLVGDTAYFFDKDKKKIIELEIATKKFTTFDLSNIEAIAGFAADEESIFVLADGVYKRELSSETTEKVIDQGKSNENAELISVFNENLYVLNTSQRNIYKYTYDSEEDEYGEPIRWVRSAVGLEFDQVVSMIVDGDIWLSTKDGKLFQLSGGEGALFEINGLAEALTSQVYLFTKPDYENIYILEPASSRLIVVNKNGDFVKEVKSASLATASGFVVSEETAQAIVISGSLVFEVGL
jgi:hypothetical protein